MQSLGAIIFGETLPPDGVVVTIVGIDKRLTTGHA
jgi:hypothetical protein